MDADYGLEGIVYQHGLIVLDATAMRLNDTPTICHNIEEKHRYKTLLIRLINKYKRKIRVSKDTFNVLQAGLEGLGNNVVRLLEADVLRLLSDCIIDLGHIPTYEGVLEAGKEIKHLFDLRGGEYSTIAQAILLSRITRGGVAFLSNNANLLRAATYWNDRERGRNLSVYTKIDRKEYIRINPFTQTKSLQNLAVLSAPQQ